MNAAEAVTIHRFVRLSYIKQEKKTTRKRKRNTITSHGSTTGVSWETSTEPSIRYYKRTKKEKRKQIPTVQKGVLRGNQINQIKTNGQRALAQNKKRGNDKKKKKRKKKEKKEKKRNAFATAVTIIISSQNQIRNEKCMCRVCYVCTRRYVYVPPLMSSSGVEDVPSGIRWSGGYPANYSVP